MKKILILLVSLLLVISIVYFALQEQTITQNSNEVLLEPSQSTQGIPDESVSDINTDSEVEQPLPKDNKVASKPFSLRRCIESVDKKYPGMNIGLYIVTSKVYADGEIAAGRSPYQTMPTASLKSLAAADDVDALFVLGQETMWLATTGLMVNEHSDVPKLSSEEKSAILKNHELDFELLEEGEEYLFRAAVLGKLGGLGEFSSLTSMGFRRLSKSDAEDKRVKKLIAKVMAYSELTREIHREDDYLQEIMGGQLESIERRVLQPFVELEDFESFKQDIQKIADSEFELLYQRWKERRNYYGLPVHPKIITDELTDYSEEMAACHKKLNNIRKKSRLG